MGCQCAVCVFQYWIGFNMCRSPAPTCPEVLPQEQWFPLFWFCGHVFIFTLETQCAPSAQSHAHWRGRMCTYTCASSGAQAPVSAKKNNNHPLTQGTGKGWLFSRKVETKAHLVCPGLNSPRDTRHILPHGKPANSLPWRPTA